MNLERKLQILEGEWFVESSYQSDENAALYAFYQPTQGPFIIVPSMIKEELTSEFTLTSKYRVPFFFYVYCISFLIVFLQFSRLSTSTFRHWKKVEMLSYLANGLKSQQEAATCTIKHSSKK